MRSQSATPQPGRWPSHCHYTDAADALYANAVNGGQTGESEVGREEAVLCEKDNGE